MEGILRFQQATDSWVIEHEEHFRILKDDKGQAYGAETITKSIQVEPHSCPGSYPTDILAYDGMKVVFEIATLDDPDGIIKKDFAKINWETPKNNLSVEEVTKNIVHSQVTCLKCGEVLVSEHRHDYKICSCPNETMVDGGNEYVRYGGKDLSKVETFTVFDTDDFKFVRRYASRGGRGVDGREPLTWTKLCDMNDSWLQAVLDYYTEGTDNPHLRLIRKEIKYRKENRQNGKNL